MRQILFNKIIFCGSIIFFLLLSIGSLNAQDSLQFKKNEIWGNFFNSGANYKRALNSKIFLKTGVAFDFRIGKSERDNYYSSSNPSEHNKYNTANQYINFYLGIEKRSVLSSKMTLFHGPEISYGLSGNQSKNKNKDKDENSYQETNQNGHTIGAGYSIGVIYSLNSLLGIGVGWSPRIYYNFTTWENTYHYANSQDIQTNSTKDNNLGVQLSTPTLSLILKF